MQPTTKGLWGRLVNYRFRYVTDFVRRLRGWNTTKAWRNGTIAHATRYGLQHEVAAEFDDSIRQGCHPSIAQWIAFCEWDI